MLHWHGDPFDLPKGAIHFARSQACENQTVVYEKNVIGLQFHLEMTVSGAKEIISNCSDDLVEGNFIQNPKTILEKTEPFSQANAQMHSRLSKLEN